jgi:STE24 endopeptidase
MVNLPDGMASALVKTAEYRNPRPGPLEEWLFCTHPSVERRVQAALEWKAGHPDG